MEEVNETPTDPPRATTINTGRVQPILGGGITRHCPDARIVSPESGRLKLMRTWAQKKRLRRKKLFARELRNDMTPPERMLWEELRSNRTGYKWHRQKVLYGYIADFYCPEKHIIVEVDGKQHEQQKSYDQHRDEVFAHHGIITIRIPASAIFQNVHTAITPLHDLLVTLNRPLTPYSS